MKTLCTISTSSHLYKVFALAESIARYDGELKVLLIDSEDANPLDGIPKNVEIHFLKSLESKRAARTIEKYKKDKLRWALKPVYLAFLLKNFEKVIYVDNDMYFFNDHSFLFDDLNRYNIILTPHFYPVNPENNQTWLEANYRLGLYNAGFIGVNKNAKKALEWWSDCCLYEMKRSYWRGLFDDQKYLDLFPILFENVKIIKNNGCNFAGWNDHLGLTKKEVVCVHFNSFTISKFKNPTHSFFDEYKIYCTSLKKYNIDFQVESDGWNAFEIYNGVYFVKWKCARRIHLLQKLVKNCSKSIRNVFN